MGSAEEQWAVVYQPLQELKAEPAQAWTEQRDVFLGKLGLSDSAQDPAVDAFVRRLDDLTDDQRVELLRTDEVDTVLYDLLQQHQPREGYDETAWAEFLTANGPYWDGDEETWTQFHEWFVHEAGGAGFGEPAQALVAYLDGLPVDDRITAFGQYGVVIEAPRGDGTTLKRKREVEPADKKGKGKATAKATAKADEVEEPDKKKPRVSPRTAAKLAANAEAPMLLTVVTTKDQAAVRTQKLAAEQIIGFRMDATLTKSPGEQGAIDVLYEFRQYVRDSYTRNTDSQDLGEFEVDGPFQPNYGGGVCVVTPNAIQFNDAPGYSTDTKIPAGDWLSAYQVEFFWVVTRIADGLRWRSPTLVNSVSSTWSAGVDAPVTYAPESGNWNIGPADFV